ncbi:hypothetical protein GWI72_02285 [Microvirga tunisiensis]|uniref:Uncharacterized protein n=2 Tax=Pannonibacter tanglangensis TaxID=2750084 RepID=A0ABW9ZF31_9HYPH|nr:MULTISPECIES: hypothetical protein [unclassified Pannonibacter]NBN63454.1 hypothetical protein [Pannonibacter sp. XCT-34]NBN77091.1 hypothetical protein [Pannonibacter sp. XCT-53]
MNRILLALAVSLSALWPLSGQAASEDEIYAQVETLLGDAEGLDPFLEELRRALVTGTARDVAKLVAFPLPVNNNGTSFDIRSAKEFERNYERLVTEATKDLVASADYTELFVSSDGVSIGDGAVWIAPVCDNQSCTRSHWALVSINN